LTLDDLQVIMHLYGMPIVRYCG